MGFWNRSGAATPGCSVLWEPLAPLTKKGELLTALKTETACCTPEDLEAMLTRYAQKLSYVPDEYAAALLASARTQIVDGYHRMMTTNLDHEHENVRLAPSWEAVVRPAAARSDGKRLAGFKYLIAAFTMYIAGEPAHPVGTPFPGGFQVELHEGVYYCPVCAAQGTVDAALCQFCPVVQSRERDLVLTRQQREFIEREEKLGNYFTNYHG